MATRPRLNGRTLETLSATDRENPHELTAALERSLLCHQKKTSLFMASGLLLGVAGMAGAMVTGSALLIWAAAALMAARTIHARMVEVPRIRRIFNDAAADMTTADKQPRAELQKLSEALAPDRSSLASWKAEFDPHQHFMRVPVAGFILLFGAVTVSPAIIATAVFITALSLLDQQGDFVQKINDQATISRGKLKAWRTGIAPAPS